MIVTKERLLKAVEDNSKRDFINMGELISDIGVSPRDLYYYAEAKFILGELECYYTDKDSNIIVSALEKDETLELALIGKIVGMTQDYSSTVEYEDFIEQAIEVINKEIFVTKGDVDNE